MRLGVVVLPEGICGKAEGFGEDRCGASIETKPDGFDANSPGPQFRPLGGFRAAGAHGVVSLARRTTTVFATLLVDRLAVRETELTTTNRISL